MATFISKRSERLHSVLPTHTFSLHDQTSERRGEAEQAVKRIFRQVYSADIGDFSPMLLTAERNDKIDTVIGLRNAAQDPLFLESYLDEPIEQLLKRQHNLTIERQCFIELGNLVAIRSGSSRMLFIVLAFALAKAGVKWATFTATPEVTRLLTKLGLAPIAICKASGQAVVNGESQWGTYYDDAPTVCFGNVSAALKVMTKLPTVNAIYHTIEPVVNRLAAQIIKGFRL